MVEPSATEQTTPRREPIRKRVRFEVLRRDNYTCRYCKSTDGPLTIDHVTPEVLGGSNDPSNLVAACKDCNAGKSSSSPDEDTVAQVSDDAARWAAAMKLSAERLASNKVAVREQLQPWFDEWFLRAGIGWSYKLPDDAAAVLEQYLAAGMPIEVLIDAARIALRKRDADGYFRYFRGVANNMLAELQRDAAAILAAGSTTEPEACMNGVGCTCPAHAWKAGFDDAFLVPLVWDSWIQARALSRVVDGPYLWNTKRKDAA